MKHGRERGRSLLRLDVANRNYHRTRAEQFPSDDECIEQAEATREPGGALNPAG